MKAQGAEEIIIGCSDISTICLEAARELDITVIDSSNCLVDAIIASYA